MPGMEVSEQPLRSSLGEPLLWAAKLATPAGPLPKVALHTSSHALLDFTNLALGQLLGGSAGGSRVDSDVDLTLHSALDFSN